MRVKGNQMNMVSRIGAVKPLAAIAVVIALASTAVWQSTAQAQSTSGICGRTAQVQEVILHETGVSNCANVTAEHLSGITGLLNLSTADMPDLLAIITTPITSLKAGDFAGLSGVTELRLMENNITRIDRNMLTGLTSLERLDLTDNPYTSPGRRLTLASDAFADVTGLKELKLRFNQMTSMSSQTFSDLTSLEELDLSRNLLTTLNENVFADLDSLEKLDLSNVGGPFFTSLPEDLLDGLDNLKELSFGDNEITALPADIFDGLDSLEKLSFYGNEISELPDDIFDGLDNLERLNMGGNEIDELPDGLFKGLGSLWLVWAHGNPGAPFDITVELESREADEGNEVYATVATGAPFPITVTLSVEDGDGTTGILSSSTLTVPAGATESNAASITPDDDYPNATLAIDSLSFEIPSPPAGTVANFDRDKGLNLIDAMDSAPVVTGLAITSEPSSPGLVPSMLVYSAGDEIEFTVTFSENVSVTGTPRLKLFLNQTDRSTGRFASYDSTSDSELTFAYTVDTSDTSLGGLVVPANPIDLNGGTIQDSDGNAARLETNGLLGGTSHMIYSPRNTAATGAPTISGTAQVGQTLTASTTGISDADGLTNVSYSYQWLADDTEIDGATSSTYTVQASDNGKVIKVRVTFNDDAGNEETLSSAGTSAVVLGGL